MVARTLAYSLKVWITTIVVGEMVFFSWLSLLDSGFNLIDVPWQLAGYVFLFALVASMPALLLFWWGANYFCRKLDFPRQRRLRLALMSFVLTFVSVLIAVWAVGGPSVYFALVTALSYYVVALAAIYFYRLPEPRPGIPSENV